MATTPCTIVVFTEDKVNFPIKSAMVVMKQLFQYGVKEMYSKGEKIFISLSYSPRTLTLKRKFGNLPVRYMRAKIEKEEEFKILENVVKRFRFNLLDEQIDNMGDRKLIEAPGDMKRKYLELPKLDTDEWLEEEETPQQPAKRKRRNICEVLPSTSAQIFDLDNVIVEELQNE